MLCSEAILVNQGADEGHAVILRCRRWSCEICRPFNHKKIKRCAREGVPTTFLTLTVVPSRYETHDEAARDLKRAWVNLRRALTRRFGGEKPPFIAVFESTKKGWPHLHILLRMRWVPAKYISDYMRQATGAYVMKIKYVRDRSGVAAYVAKYVSKAPEAFKGCKRWWRSHDYAIEAEDKSPFRVFGAYVSEIRVTLESFTRERLKQGFVVVEESPNYVHYQWWTKAGAPSPWAMGSGP